MIHDIHSFMLEIFQEINAKVTWFLKIFPMITKSCIPIKDCHWIKWKSVWKILPTFMLFHIVTAWLRVKILQSFHSFMKVISKILQWWASRNVHWNLWKQTFSSCLPIRKSLKRLWTILLKRTMYFCNPTFHWAIQIFYPTMIIGATISWKIFIMEVNYLWFKTSLKIR